LIGDNIPLENEAGLVNDSESSRYSEKLLATLERIFHISTCLLGLIPYDHLSNYYNKFPIVQFQLFA
jgi:hypothetical protein